MARGTILGVAVALVFASGQATASTQSYFGVSQFNVNAASATAPGTFINHSGRRSQFITDAFGTYANAVVENFEAFAPNLNVPDSIDVAMGTINVLQRQNGGPAIGSASFPGAHYGGSLIQTRFFNSSGGDDFEILLDSPASAFGLDMVYGTWGMAAGFRFMLGDQLVHEQSISTSWLVLNNEMMFYGVRMLGGQVFDRVVIRQTDNPFTTMFMDNFMVNTVQIIPLPTGAGLAFAGLGVLAARRRTRG